MTGHVYMDRYDLGPGDAELLASAAPCADGFWHPMDPLGMRARAFAEWWFCATGQGLRGVGTRYPPRIQGPSMLVLEYPRYGWHWYTTGGLHLVGLPAAAHVALAALWWPLARLPDRLAAAASLVWARGDVRRMESGQ